MGGVRKAPSARLIKFKTKLAVISFCLTILVMLITLSIIFGIMTKEDWQFWK